MKSLRFALLGTALLTFGVFASQATAQSVDGYFGFNTMSSRTPLQGIPKEGGGLFPNAAGEVIFFHGIGIGADVTWRGSVQNYQGNPVRPIFYDFNAVWQPVRFGRAFTPDFTLGVGAQSIRAYTSQISCSVFGGCTNYFSSSHFALHAGVGLMVNITDHIFVRPGIDFFNIKNNIEYQVPGAWRYGIAIGYMLGK